MTVYITYLKQHSLLLRNEIISVRYTRGYCMNISFWDCLNKQSCLSEIVAAVGGFMVQNEKRKICICENHAGSHSMEQYFRVNMMYGLQKDLSKRYLGIEEVFLGADNHHVNLDKCFYEIVPKHLSYLVHQQDKRIEYLDYVFNEAITPLLEYCNRMFDYCLFSVNHGFLSTKALLDKSDMVAILLPKQTNEYSRIMKAAASILFKSIFIYYHQNNDDLLSLRAFIKKYKIPKDRVAIIHSNEAYESAVRIGGGYSFINGLSLSSEATPEYTFLQQLSRISNLIVRKSNEYRKNSIA